MLAEKTHATTSTNSVAIHHDLPRFWQNWLYAWCAGVALFGLVLAGAAFEATSGPTRAIFDLLNGELVDFTPHIRFSVGLLGAVTFGWSLTLAAAITAAIQLNRSGQTIWRLLTASILAWYVIDSSISIATGFGLNAASNTVIVAGYLLPLIRSGVLR